MNSIENKISSKVAADNFEFSKHAVDQMMHRNILVHEVREALSAPEILEHYPNDKYGPSCLVLGFSSKGKALHVVCTHPDQELLKIITIYEPDPKLWLDFSEKIDRKLIIYDRNKSHLYFGAQWAFLFSR
jgi:hypothetical protein